MAAPIHKVVHTLREKPLHVRENIAVGVAGGVTFIVAVLWFVSNAASGTFSLSTPTLASGDASSSLSDAVTTSKGNFTTLLGAAGSAFSGSSSPATVQIVDTEVHTSLDTDQPDPNATVIKF